jgi:tetratricopeptide (TPR) repeat protein
MTTTNTYLQGQKAFLDGDMENSIKAFSDTLECGLHSFHSHLNRGIAYFKIGQFFRAIEDFDSILNTDNSHARALLYRGLANLNMGKNEEAIHDLDRPIPSPFESFYPRDINYMPVVKKFEMARH